MTGMNLKQARLKQRIYSLDLQINTKQNLVKNLIDQKHELRQAYLVSMEKVRQNLVDQNSGIARIQEDYNSDIENLDKEERFLALELDELLNQRDWLSKTLLNHNTGPFLSKKSILVFLTFTLFVVCWGMLITQKHVLFRHIPQQQEVHD